MIEFYGYIYLRHPIRSDIEQLYAAHRNTHSILRMIGSIHCTHWKWINCSNVWQCQYTHNSICPGFGMQDLWFWYARSTMMLEAVVLQDLWFWYAYFDMSGSNNDLNVLGASSIFNEINKSLLLSW